MTPTDTLREAVIDAILWSRWHEEDDVRGPEWFAALKADYDDHHDQAKADADAALSAIEAAGWRVVKAPSVDDIEAMILATEPDVPACVDGSKIWTRRMAKALHDRLSAAPRLDATVRGWICQIRR